MKMKHLNRLLALICAASLFALSFSACGSKTEAPAEPAATEESTEESAAAEPAEAESDDAAEEPAEEAAAEETPAEDEVMIVAQSGLPAGVEYQFLGELDTGSIGVATVAGNLYYGGTYDVVASIATYRSGYSWGEWRFEDGVFYLDDDYNDYHFEVPASEDGSYTFNVSFMNKDVPVTAVMDSEKPLSALNVDPDPEASKPEDPADREPYAQPEQQERYADTTDEDWAAMWAEAEAPYNEEGLPLMRDYGATSLDSLFESSISKDLFAPVPEDQRGTVERVAYETYAYTWYERNQVPEEEWEPLAKDCYVYLPAGYDESKQYNVYYLMHGAGGNETNWFTMCCGNLPEGQGGECGNGDFVVLMDNLIAQGIIEPTIFVSATTNVNLDYADKALKYTFAAGDAIANFPFEMENDLIPAIEGTYASYAKSTDHDGLVASREHRAFAGLSGGAYQTWICMFENIDVMAYYAPIANGSYTSEDPATEISGEYQQLLASMDDKYEIGFLLAHDGKKDTTFNEETETVNQFLDQDTEKKFRYGENMYYYIAENGTHTPKYFILGVYNSMKVFFK